MQININKYMSVNLSLIIPAAPYTASTRKRLGVFHFLLLLSILSPAASGQLVAWNVNGIDAETDPSLSGVLGPNIAFGELTLGSGVSPSGTANTFGGSNFNQTSLAAAITQNDYLAFTVAPAAGHTFSVSSITINPGLSSATDFNIALFSSAGGYEVDDILWSYSFNATLPSAQMITLSDFPELQDLASETEFRLYGWRGTAGTSTFRIRDLSGYDLVINGSTGIAAVPEPSTYAIASGFTSLLAVIILRRNHRRHPGSTKPARSRA